MILLIDNYDSFVHNLARYVQELGLTARVVRNDELTLAEIASLAPAAVILSPGPCTPSEAGISVDLVRELGQHIPILGVCLGHQAIVAAFGGDVIRAPQPVHGRRSEVQHAGTPLFRGIPTPFAAARYHSLIADEATLPDELVVTARTADGIPMAVEHRSRPIYGVQFHPESVLTEGGHRLLANFLEMAGLQPSLPRETAPHIAAPPTPAAPWHVPVSWSEGPAQAAW